MRVYQFRHGGKWNVIYPVFPSLSCNEKSINTSPYPVLVLRKGYSYIIVNGNNVGFGRVVSESSNGHTDKMARIIAVCNQKGGVGKTTTSVNLGAYLAGYGRRVLLLDFDPQANASSALGYADDGKGDVYHGILGKVKPYDLVRASRVDNFHYIPAGANLAGATVELLDVPGREYYLRNFLSVLSEFYDYVFIDLPPSLSMLTINGLIAANEVMIPVQAEYYSLEGLSQILQTIELIRANMDHDLKVSGAVITMFDRWEQLSQEVARNLRANFPHKVYNTEIPRSVHLAEAPSFNQPISVYAPNSSGAVAYRALAEEMIAEERSKEGAEASPADIGYVR